MGEKKKDRSRPTRRRKRSKRPGGTAGSAVRLLLYFYFTPHFSLFIRKRASQVYFFFLVSNFFLFFFSQVLYYLSLSLSSLTTNVRRKMSVRRLYTTFPRIFEIKHHSAVTRLTPVEQIIFSPGRVCIRPSPRTGPVARAGSISGLIGSEPETLLF